MTHGTGRFNVSLGAITAATGIGASVSNVVAGAIVVAAGYNAACTSLGGIAGAGLVLHFLAMPETARTDGAVADSKARPADGSDQYHSFAPMSPPSLADVAFCR